MDSNNVVVLCDHYSELAKHTPIWNSAEVVSTVCVSLPAWWCPHWRLFEIVSCIPDISEPLTYDNFVSCTGCHPWIDITADWLDLAPGQHIYRMGFVDCTTNIVRYGFFSYIIQDDTPDKPYIYINRTFNCGN